MVVEVAGANIDWAATGAMLQGIGGILGAAAVSFAAYLGYKSFETWGKQKLDERRIEQAERILSATYSFQSAIYAVRTSILVFETTSKFVDLVNILDWKKHFRELYSEQIDLIKDVYNNLAECRPIGRSLFGDKIDRSIGSLCSVYYLVKSSINIVYADHTDFNDPALDSAKRNIQQGLGGIKNEVDKDIVENVEIIKNICDKYLKNFN
jgi:hypothetical protein